MIVCICARISDRQIREAAAGGAHSLECLKSELGVAMCCGNCADCAVKVLGEARAEAAARHSAAAQPVAVHRQAACCAA